MFNTWILVLDMIEYFYVIQRLQNMSHVKKCFKHLVVHVEAINICRQQVQG